MNRYLNRLQPYPFEKLGALLQDLAHPADRNPISLSIGEPKHPAAKFILQAYREQTGGLSLYPNIKGKPELRLAISQWLERRFHLPPESVDPDRHVLPANGTREALFACIQALFDASRAKPLVLMPNPFYQIYEGAALLAGAEPHFVNCTHETGYLPDFDSVTAETWARCQVLFICNPGNPSGSVMDIPALQKLLDLAEKYDFVIASDECYSEIYFDENAPPPGLLEAAAGMGNTRLERCLVFHSLSKRSNLPGLRSGFVAGDAKLIAPFFRYRTYHGCAMPVQVQHTSIAAWEDETHVIENRELYRQKFETFTDILSDALELAIPPGSFYLWPRLPIDDETFVRELYRQQGVTCLPGHYLGRAAHGINPGENHVRLALVSSIAECREAACRIKSFLENL